MTSIRTEYGPLASGYAAPPFPLDEPLGSSQLVVMIAPADAASILSTVVWSLPLDLPAAVLILVNGETDRNRLIATNLNKGRFSAEAGQIGTQLRDGHAVVVRSESFLAVGQSMRLKMCTSELRESKGPVLLRSLASRFGANAIVVVLTGLDEMEPEAVQELRLQGGRIIALDDSDRGWLHEKSPKVIPNAQDTCLAAEAIAAEVTRIVSTRAARSEGL